MKNKNRGFGLFGLLITFAVIILMLWYSLDLLKPVSNNPEAPKTIKEQIGVIESAKQVKDLVEKQSQQTATQLNQ